MFGAYRTILALFVVLSHLGGIPGFGGYAVFGFYTLSGYLMTLILQTNYGYSPRGVLKYAFNRFLRIFPPYWVAASISVALVLWLSQKATIAYHPAIFLPKDLPAVLRHVFIVFDYQGEPRLVPPAWALTIEFCFYILMGLGLSRTRLLTVLWFLAGAIYTVTINVLGWDFAHRYYTIAASSLPFSTGAMIFHFRNELRRSAPWLAHFYAPAVLLCLWLVNLMIALRMNSHLTWGFYLNYFLNAALVAALVDRAALPVISKSADRTLGDLSYPIYLVHYQAGLLLLSTGWIKMQRGEPLFALAALPFLLLLAWLLTRFVERPIEELRRRVKKSRHAVSIPASETTSLSR